MTGPDVFGALSKIRGRGIIYVTKEKAPCFGGLARFSFRLGLTTGSGYASGVAARIVRQTTRTVKNCQEKGF